ncbi:hypothetical protein ATO12_18385 [Aquimarina atlantica]|uniref:Uncharacterized protein n=1 Tax=Aquimarina atlantica TaxID=1317122 RepID=A0A023BSM7_9FLAO|nr:hypothetical protein ATO12_18385 [Aquimarina atlantica]
MTTNKDKKRVKGSKSFLKKDLTSYQQLVKNSTRKIKNALKNDKNALKMNLRFIYIIERKISICKIFSF